MELFTKEGEEKSSGEDARSPLCSGLARDLCFGKYQQLRGMNLPPGVLNDSEIIDSEELVPLKSIFNRGAPPAQTYHGFPLPAL